jgi:predicted nucleic acid-binding protein
LNVAYVDTSALVSLAFDERGGRDLAAGLESYDVLYASNLLEAELGAAFQREEVPVDAQLLSWIAWILPDRPLTAEIARVQAAGYLRGADLWHLACALYLSPDPAQVTFVTLDGRQGEVARRLGFRGWPRPLSTAAGGTPGGSP